MARLAWLYFVLFGIVQNSASDSLDRRYEANFTSPAHYRYSWGIDHYRCSYDSSSGHYLTRSQITGQGSVSQKSINSCAAFCDNTPGCGFFHPVQMTGSSEGDVVCALYRTKQNKAAATISVGPASSGGSVVASYGFTRDSAVPASASSSTSRTSAGSIKSATRTLTVSTQRSTTSSSLAPSASSSFPVPPPGARLAQLAACSSSKLTIPLLVNKQYPGSGNASSADTVWIVQHGLGRDFDEYFTSVYNVVGDTGILIAPNFYAKVDAQAPNSWYQPTRNFAWNGNDWSTGDDAVAPSGVQPCSSFDVYDALIASLRDKGRFPNVKRIFIVAHSRGSAMAARYGMLSSNTDVRYVLANAPVMPYFTSARPLSSSNCADYNLWGYGWAEPLPRYVSAKNPGPVHAFRNWVAQDITWLTGDLDTYSRDQTGDQTCMIQTQGGQNRRDRGYAFWAYINLLGGTRTNVSDYYGYDALKRQVTSVSPSAFNVRNCVVDGVAHDNFGMFASDCGRAAINGASSVPAGPGPVRPS